MLSIKQIYSEEDMLVLGKLKMELMRYHLEYAEQFGISDHELLQYTLEQALSTASSRDNFLFFMNDEPIGMAQVEEQISSVDSNPILFVHSMYIKPDTRNRSIGGIFLRRLCKKYKKRIECECWYNIPASELYIKAGFQPLVTRYILPQSSRFYGSAQN